MPVRSRRNLLAWYRRRRRDLPWRRTGDPYAIWVSEIMLQQTRVAAVVPFYERFLRRFPEVLALARARLDTVLALWSGLGYYRRARHLHAAAKILSREGFPRTAAAWRRLPGVGPYTAAAVASIAFGEPVAVVDGNVERVLCRLHALTDRDPRRLRARAQAWLAPRAPGDHNQAVMELGATVCTPRSPACPRCPLRGSCRGRAAPARYPGPKRRARPVTERRAVAFVRRNGKVFLRRRAGPGLLSGLWDLPPARRRGEPLAVVRHGVLERRLILEVFARRPRGEGRWFSARQVARLPLATAARKCLRHAGFLVVDFTT
ncbi:MAG: A/G-specific adenine glycosylase [Planctomycetota bacterium]|jgi:A/G-specific adenine glycosylase